MTETRIKPRALPNDLVQAVRFARFCAEHSIDPPAAAQLILAGRRAFKAGENNCNIGNEASQNLNDKAQDAFEALADSLGFRSEWNGLWPSLVRDGREINLPVI